MFASIVLAVGLALGACAERTPGGAEEAAATPSEALPSTPGLSASTPVAVTAVSKTTVEPQTMKTPQETPVPSEFQPFALDPMRELLAKELNLPLEQITLISWQAVTWRDSCLGVHRPREACLTVITPGYTLKFLAGPATAVVNTDATGKNFRLAQKDETPGPLPALSWTRTGGFAGVCQTLSVYSTGSYWLKDCKTGQVLAQGVLSGEQQAYLNGLFEQYAPFEWKPKPMEVVPDSFYDQIQFYGIGSQAMPEAEQEKLNEYLAQLAGDLARQPTSSTGTGGDSGISGQVFVGPTCGGPIGSANSTECADKPYAATITVLDPAGKMVTSFSTDAEGRFRLTLEPGKYTLHPESSGAMPAAVDVPVQVVSGQFLVLTITYDSGMR
jgi:hypothetical protein